MTDFSFFALSLFLLLINFVVMCCCDCIIFVMTMEFVDGLISELE